MPNYTCIRTKNLHSAFPINYKVLIEFEGSGERDMTFFSFSYKYVYNFPRKRRLGFQTNVCKNGKIIFAAFLREYIL